MLKLEYFYYVIEIDRVKSINKAAQNLYISQPYLSLSLKKTEEILGIKIFNRTSRGVLPTAAGKEFIKYSKEILELVEKSNNLKNKYSIPKQKLSVTSMPSFTILDIFQEFKAMSEEKFQNIKLSYNEVPNPLIPENVVKGITDIGLIYTSSREIQEDMEKFEELALNFTPLIKEPLYAVVSSKNKLYARDSISLEDLKDMNFLVETVKLYKNSPPVENNPLPDIFKREDRHTLEFNNNRSMLHYLSKRGDYFCIGQKSLNLTNPSVLGGNIKYIPIVDLDIHFTLGYLTNENISSNELQEIFIDFIEDYFKNYENYYKNLDH